MAVVSFSGKLLERSRSNTSIPEVVAMIEQVRRPRFLTFEEGPLAAWLARNLRPYVDQLLVCDPRRNHLIAKDSDKDDPLDAEKLAQLLRGGYLKPVHHPESLERELLKQHVSFYHDRVRERVRQGHQLVAQLRRHGVFVPIDRCEDDGERRAIWRKLPQHKLLLDRLDLLWQGYRSLQIQEAQVHSQLIRLARREEPVRRFQELPGVGWIRAVTFYVYIDTPWRFKSRSALHRYCGLGLERRHSGQGPTRIRLMKQGNRRLKNVLVGAARSAVIQSESPFALKYRHLTQEEGIHPSAARRSVARQQATTLWSLWKSGQHYDPKR
jgi:transposase